MYLTPITPSEVVLHTRRARLLAARLGFLLGCDWARFKLVQFGVVGYGARATDVGWRVNDRGVEIEYTAVMPGKIHELHVEGWV